MKEEEAKPHLMTIAEVARILCISEPMVYVLHDRGQLDMVKIGRLSRITVQSFEKFLATLPQAPRTQAVS